MTDDPDGRALAARVEHTLLRPDATAADVDRLCDEARLHRLGGVCVAGPFVARAVARLEGSGVAVVAVAGFPSGAVPTRAKALEAELAVRAGAAEVDVVADLGSLRAGDLEAVARDLAAVVVAARGRPVKAILETAAFAEAEVAAAARAAERAGVRFVKTSTGFGPGGATLEAVRTLRASVGPRVGVKASGGVRDRAFALALVAAGADRLGTSAGVVIVRPERAPRG